MAKGLLRYWKQALASLAFCVATIAALAYVDHGSPGHLHTIVGILLGVVCIAATAAPALPFLALIPWHFVALRRGLIRRTGAPCIVSLSHGTIHVLRGDNLTSHPLDLIVRARYAENDNWTESKTLEDAVGLFASSDREIARLPRSATGVDALLIELGARGIPIEHVGVSAPAVLD